jgi:hypothetical protein
VLRYESDEQWSASERYGAANGLQHIPGLALKAPAAVAYVNQGRWVADCPFGCGTARGVARAVNYWCAGCGNTAVGGQEVAVTWPDDFDAIESVLVLRPTEANRNWSPFARVPGRNRIGEDAVKDLAVENLERGLPVPISLQSAANAFLAADWTARGLAGEMMDWEGAPVRERRNPLQGPKGDKGDPGPKGDKGDPGTGPIRVGQTEGVR